MKLGFGLYRHMLDEDHFRFARQCGATHVVIHLVDYFGHDQEKANQPVGERSGWGKAGSGELWSLDMLLEIKEQLHDHDLTWAAIENFDPAMWHDVLLDGPEKEKQIETLKEQIRIVGEAGIPVFGYNFSLAGVTGRKKGPFARGDAESVAMDDIDDRPVPNGMVWNMVYDENALDGTLPSTSHEELWDRVQYFLDELIPVAEKAGVKLAAHPDDPPVPVLRQTPRLVYQPEHYEKLLDLHPSDANRLEFCLGSISEMTEGDIYDATEKHSQHDEIGYIHFRNVRGEVPDYREVFVDEGDIDMLRILQILERNDYQGVLVPDHTPLMTCDAPWYAGMAYTMGYMKAAIQSVKGGSSASN